MIGKLLQKIFRRKKRKPFSAWQIELTTRCPLRCRMCARQDEASWQYRDMALDDLKRLLPYLADVETVILEGWGESLLHKDLDEIIRLVKQEGPRVGFVTSGFGLTRDRVREVVQAGVDFVGFSVSGAKTETHDAIRVNSHLPDLLAAIRFFQEETQSLGLPGPRMHIVFLMLRDNIQEVPLIPALAKEAGIEELFLINSCHIADSRQDAQRVFIEEEAAGAYEDLIKQAEHSARKLKIRLRKSSLCGGDVSVCSENPLRNLYISVEGEVAPCVYLHPPLPSPFKRLFRGKEHWVEKVSFGNIFNESFPDIWGSDAYRGFRGCFLAREKRFRDMLFSFQDFSSDPMDVSLNVLPLPPEPCGTCHKIIGV
jgi:MoaA/NifB/PqqE/SkfB family radical SAM enzyme